MQTTSANNTTWMQYGVFGLVHTHTYTIPRQCHNAPVNTVLAAAVPLQDNALDEPTIKFKAGHAASPHNLKPSPELDTSQIIPDNGTAASKQFVVRVAGSCNDCVRRG